MQDEEVIEESSIKGFSRSVSEMYEDPFYDNIREPFLSELSNINYEIRQADTF